MNIIPKQDGHAMVASFDSQYWHCGESDEIAAPQLGQLRVCACMSVRGHLAAATLPPTANYFLLKNAGRINEGCAMLTASTWLSSVFPGDCRPILYFSFLC